VRGSRHGTVPISYPSSGQPRRLKLALPPFSVALVLLDSDWNDLGANEIRATNALRVSSGPSHSVTKPLGSPKCRTIARSSVAACVARCIGWKGIFAAVTVTTLPSSAIKALASGPSGLASASASLEGKLGFITVAKNFSRGLASERTFAAITFPVSARYFVNMRVGTVQHFALLRVAVHRLVGSDQSYLR